MRTEKIIKKRLGEIEHRRNIAGQLLALIVELLLDIREKLDQK